MAAFLLLYLSIGLGVESVVLALGSLVITMLINDMKSSRRRTLEPEELINNLGRDLNINVTDEVDRVCGNWTR
uniref:Uncharacterized protein n=1 Tax=Panagrolaimus sp. ES5 TaxID=591445 RepID=A0AC34F9B3_9BILA